MECPVCKHRWSSSQVRNDFDAKFGRSSSTDAVIDSATNVVATAQPPPDNSDNSHPSGGPRISSAPAVHNESVPTLSAALEAFQSRANESRKDSKEASKSYWHHPLGQTQVDHQFLDDDDAEEEKYHENEMETYGSLKGEENHYVYLDVHGDEVLEDGEEDLQEEEEAEEEEDDDDDDWEEFVD